MPFKFHLKKSRRYSVVSKNQYVICVELLDRTSVECTLEMESVGHECLTNVTQRLGIGQPELFGLRYVCRYGGDPSFRWIDMDKPLKRQLEKDAKDLTLYLRVMYYVSDAQLVHDEMTRYHYYLQLKSDVLEERVHCDARRAIVLAAHWMQAEFGNYDAERHAPEWLRQHTFFPKSVIQAEPGGAATLLAAALRRYETLTGVTQAVAEELYISIAVRLEGYGHETFAAKDNANNDIILGVSLTGIMVDHAATRTSRFYRWKDISNVINHKKSFKIECQSELDDGKQFVFGDSRSAKYVWRLCIAQHTFYMQHQDSRGESERHADYFEGDTATQVPTSSVTTAPPMATVATTINTAANAGTTIEAADRAASLAPEKRGGDGHTRWTSYNDLSTSSPYTPVAPAVPPADSNNLRALLPSYRPAPDYETAVQIKYNNGGAGGVPPQPYYANQSTIVGIDISCLMTNVINRNRY